MKPIKIVTLLTLLIAGLFNASFAFAHVVVNPESVGVAAFQTFAVSVPNEKDTQMVALKLLIPDGLQSVSPTVKPGWKIDMKKSGEGDTTKVIEIDWTGGSIPQDERDDFTFSAQVPSNETTLVWKAYQTFADGSVTSWDQAPVANQTDEQREEMEKKNLGPFSQTKVINDLKATPQPAATTSQTSTDNNLTLITSIAALLLSVTAFGLQLRKTIK